jgi:hypothetical protein
MAEYTPSPSREPCSRFERIIERDTEPEVGPVYRKDRPLDRALVAVAHGKSKVLDYIGPSLDALSDNGVLQEEMSSCSVDTPPGIYIFDGKVVVERDDSYCGDTEIYLTGDFRPATEEEWNFYLDGEYPWDPNLWMQVPGYEPIEKTLPQEEVTIGDEFYL